MPDPRNEIHVTPDTHRHRTTVVRALLAAGPVLVLCSLVLTGCGSSKGATPSATTTTSTATTASAASASKSFAAYQSCLESHGVTLPQGRPSGGNGNGTPPSGRPSITPAQQKALDACADLRPTGAGGFGPGGGANSDNPAFAKFQSCLKQHGVDPTNADARGSSDFQAAMTACRSLLPDEGAGRPNFGGGAPPGAGGGQGNSAAFAKFQACLKSHGVNTSASNQSPAKTRAALSACQKLLPATGAGTQTTPAAAG